MQDSVEYLGYRGDDEDLHTSTEKVKAIMEAPQPKNQKQSRPFIGMVNYYGRFVPALSTTAHPLNNLLRHNVRWKCSKECQVAFCKLKMQLSSQPVLVYYDSSLPLILACNALQYGVGAVIAHAVPDGSEKPVAFGSRMLSKAEENDP